MKKIPKWLQYSWIACIPIGIIVALANQFCVYEAPQKKAARLAAVTNSAVVQAFGPNANVLFAPGTAAKMEFHRGGRRVGFYYYDVVGVAAKGRICVLWESGRGGQDFKAKAIQRERPGESSEVIWKSE